LLYHNYISHYAFLSNARISDENIFRILNSRGKVNIFETDVKEFNTGKIKRENNKEKK
jgi:adenine-specific DNA methylase